MKTMILAAVAALGLSAGAAYAQGVPAGSTAERWAVWPHASVDALSIGKSTSTNCDPPSGAEAKRTIFIMALRIARRPALV